MKFKKYFVQAMVQNIKYKYKFVDIQRKRLCDPMLNNKIKSGEMSYASETFNITSLYNIIIF